METGVRAATRDGDPERAITLAQRVLALDPAADAIELELLGHTRLGGWHSAAAEQYAHYAAYLRSELGAEPPPYGDV